MSYSPNKKVLAGKRRSRPRKKKEKDLYFQTIHSLRLFDTAQISMSKWKSPNASKILPFAVWDRGQLVGIVNEERTAELLMLALWSRRVVRSEVFQEYQLVKKRIQAHFEST